MSGLPFVSSILLRIFGSVKTNWERVGDVRFAVTYNPPNGEGFSKDDAKIIADEWRKAMRSQSVCDFVSVGDVSIRLSVRKARCPTAKCPYAVLWSRYLQSLEYRRFCWGFRGQALSE